MILLVHHDPDPAGQVHGSTRPDWLLVEACELLAHDMPLVQEKSVLRRKLIHSKQDAVLYGLKSCKRFPHLGENPQPLTIARSRRKSIAFEVSRQANPRRDHDVRVLAGCVEPARAAVGKQSKVEHYSIPRSLSRRSAASSNCSASIARLSRSRSSVALDT